MPPQETLRHQQVVLAQPPVGSLLLSAGPRCGQDFVCALQDWSVCFPQSCGSLTVKSCWPSGSDSLGIPSPLVGSSGWEPNVGFRTSTAVGELLWYYCFPVCGSPTQRVWDVIFIMTVPLPTSHCSFFLSLDMGHLFWGSSSTLLSMAV